MVRMGQCKTDHEDGMAPGGGMGSGLNDKRVGRGAGPCARERSQAGKYRQETWPVMGNLVGERRGGSRPGVGRGGV